MVLKYVAGCDIREYPACESRLLPRRDYSMHLLRNHGFRSYNNLVLVVGYILARCLNLPEHFR